MDYLEIEGYVKPDSESLEADISKEKDVLA